MSNWGESIKAVKEQEELVSFYPADLKFPMVAPQDIGELRYSDFNIQQIEEFNF